MATIKYTGPEKRAFLRASSRWGIKYVKLSKKLTPLMNLIAKSHTQDIGAGGVKFVARKKIPLHTIVEFQFVIPGTSKRISGLGEVVRIDPAGNDRSYNAALKFLWIQPRNAKLIDAYVRGKRIEQVVKKMRLK